MRSNIVVEMCTWNERVFLSSLGSVVIFVLLQTLAFPSPATGVPSQLHGEFFKDNVRDLTVPSREYNKSQCLKEVPAFFFKEHRDEVIRGNGSTIHFHRIWDCCPGYKRYKYDSRRCVPDCADQCVNGFCHAPNECKCFDGFVANASNVCTFTCPIGCQNGQCYLNGTCACHEGYSLDATGKLCNAICKNSCGRNQVCVQPDVCVCMEGYKMTEFGCQPECTPDCGYGKCVAPNKCECLPGYEKKRNVCQVPCYMRCENGYCESQHKCVCRDGYRYDFNTTSCIPECGDECTNGVCVAPGDCKCYKGYERKEAACVPICPGGCGYFGKCVEPKVCGCGPAGIKCKEGSCDMHGKCNCDEGLTRYVDKCVDREDLNTILATEQDKIKFSKELKNEFEKVIGNHYKI